jgi:hypothetical protein
MKNVLMKKRRFARNVALSALVAGALLVPAWAQDLTIRSQNMLRFGHGTKGDTKCDALNEFVPEADVVLLQEAMVEDNFCKVKPGAYQWRAMGPFGTQTYKEFYVFLIATGGTPPKLHFNKETAASRGSFIRTPTAVLLTVTQGKSVRQVWIGNFHAIWGKSVWERRAEAKGVGYFYEQLREKGKYEVIIGGDWNLPAKDIAEQIEAAGITENVTIAPDDPSSLTRKGEDSQPYDHFLVSPGLNSKAGVVQPKSKLKWRQEVSDHLGVEIGVR